MRHISLLNYIFSVGTIRDPSCRIHLKFALAIALLQDGRIV